MSRMTESQLAAYKAKSAAPLNAAQLVNVRDRVQFVQGAREMRDNPAERKPRSQKYGNTKVIDQGIKFDSKAEHRRWQYLQILVKAKEITELRMQVVFELVPPQKRPNGSVERACNYLADFVYLDKQGKQIVEDVKGAVTPEYRIKRKLMLWRYEIEVQEIRS